MSFSVVVGLSGFFLILLSLGLIGIDEVARDGGFVVGLCLFLLGMALLLTAMFIL